MTTQTSIRTSSSCNTAENTSSESQRTLDPESISDRLNVLRNATPQEKQDQILQQIEELLEFSLRWGIGSQPRDNSDPVQSDDNSDWASIERDARLIEHQIKLAVVLRAVRAVMSRAGTTLSQIAEEVILIESLREQAMADGRFSSHDPDEIAQIESMYMDVMQGHMETVEHYRRMIGKLHPVIDTLSEAYMPGADLHS